MGPRGWAPPRCCVVHSPVQTPMVTYVNVHGILNVQRVEACKANAERHVLLGTTPDGSGPAAAQVRLLTPTSVALLLVDRGSG